MLLDCPARPPPGPGPKRPASNPFPRPRSQGGTIHFNCLKQENGGFLFLARDVPEHLLHLRSVLSRREGLRQQILNFVQSFSRPLGMDKPCIPEFARNIENFTAQGAQKCITSITTLLLRFGLYPLAYAVRAFRPLACFKKRSAKEERNAVLRDAAWGGTDPLESLKAVRSHSSHRER